MQAGLAEWKRTLRDIDNEQHTDREVFNSVWEAQLLVQRCRRHCNEVGPHSALGYRTPAPEALKWTPSGSGTTPLLPLDGAGCLTPMVRGIVLGGRLDAVLDSRIVPHPGGSRWLAQRFRVVEQERCRRCGMLCAVQR